MASSKSSGRLNIGASRGGPAANGGKGAEGAKGAPRAKSPAALKPSGAAPKEGAATKAAKPRQKPATGRPTAPLKPAANVRGGADAPREKAAQPARPAQASRPAPPSRRAKSGGRRVAPKAQRRPRSVLGTLVRLGLTLFLFGVLCVGALIAYYAATMPPRAEWAVPERPPNVAILSDTGELIANRGDTGGRAVEIENLPDHVWEAVVAIEDHRFFSHFGVDPVGLARAMLTNLKAGALRQGGSTLTQQLAKNLFLNPSRTLERKIQEMILALWLEVQYDKEEIIEMYLNRVYLGAGAYGVDGAARRYFDKPAEDLSIAEAAVIAGLLRAPSYYSPTTSLERANARAATVLAAMEREGFITEMEALIARQNPATLATPKVASSGGYVADWVAEVLPGFAGSVSEDVVVETTVNLELQELAQASLQELLANEGAQKNVGQGAVVVLDSSGAVKALVGGRRYDDSQYNRAVDAARQPGSAFKPFVYLAALEDGLTPQTMRIDQPITIGDWTPQNYTRRHYGPVSLTKALALSLNTIAAQLAAEVGPDAVARTAQRLGIRSELSPNMSLALGTSEVTLLELTTAYVPFSNGGVGVLPHVVRRIKTAEGNLLYERRGSGPGQVVDPQRAGEMNMMLSAALTSGTAQRAQLDGWQAAGKTGTSQEWRDAWFIGYTAFFTTGVWLGNDDNSSTDRTTGGSLPAQLWNALMAKVHEGMVPAPLPGVPERVPGIDAPAALPEAGAPVAAAPQIVAPDPETGIVRAQDEGPGIGGFLRRILGGG